MSTAIRSFLPASVAQAAWRCLVVAFLALSAAPMAFAQETAADIQGRVVDRAGEGVADARVTAILQSTGNRSTTLTDGAGNFSLSGLRVGGPYRVEVAKDGAPPAAVDGVFTRLSETNYVEVPLEIGTALAEVVVTGSIDRNLVAGVGTELTAEDIVKLPTVSRDLKDFLRIDPKAVVDPFNVDALEIAGTNARYNTLFVDGIRQSDDFGLNNNGYPTQRAPIPPEWIQGLSLLSAPFDAKYGQFRGGTISIVTRAGDNDFHGGAYYFQNNDGLSGDRSKDRDLTFAFEEQTYGGWASGPIIKDKLFFFVGYERLKAETPIDLGPTGSSFAVQVMGVTQAEFEQISAISRNIYQFDPGNPSASLPENDEKILAKLDWNITDTQRMTLTYQKGEGNSIVQGDNNSLSLNRVSAPSNWYDRAFPLEQLSLQLYSDWTDNLSTEFKFGRKESTGKQDSLQGTDFAEMVITTPSGGLVYLGPDQFRHANALSNDLNQARLSFKYKAEGMVWSGGVEYEQLEIFNLFVPLSQGQYRFNSIADFAARSAQSLAYTNAFSNDANDGAATFGFDTIGLYLQNDWQITPEFRLSAGVRYDTYRSSDVPPLNQNFVNRYGFSNQETLDGRELISPRFGFNWDVTDTTTIRGGFGLFGGGTPNVWISNSFSNDGTTVVSAPNIVRGAATTPAALLPALDNVNGFDIPLIVQQALQPGNGSVNALDPGFDIPSTWVANIGLTQTFDIPRLGDNWKVTADFIHGRVRNEVVWRDLRLVEIGAAPDGRPRFARLAGTPSGADYLLTNTDEGSRNILSLSLEKSWRTSAGRFDLLFGYGYQDVEDVNPGASSTASSNWDRLATANPNDPELATSSYEFTHRFPLAITWQKPFFGEYLTSAGLFMERRSGRTYSYTFGNGTVESTTPARVAFGDPRQGARQRQLFYVPRDATDVGFEGGLTWDQLNSFITRFGLDGYRGQIAPRNAFNSPWLTVADLRLAQELPAFFEGARGIVTLDIKNVANLINKDWGRIEQVPFGFVAPVVDARIDTATNRYIYRPISGQTGPREPPVSIAALPSVWRLQLGVKFEF